MASIARREGSQAGNFGRLATAKAANDLGHDVIEVIGGGGGSDTRGARQAADKRRLFHSVPMVRGAQAPIAG